MLPSGGTRNCKSLLAESVMRAGQDRQKIGKMSKAELPRAAADLRSLRGRRAAMVLLRQPAPWTSIRYSERAIKESIPEFLLRLWNVYSFFVIYANIDGFDPAERARRRRGPLDAAMLAAADGYRPVAERGELDRWILSELHRTARGGGRADGRLRQLRRLRPAERVRRRAEQLVCAPQPGPVLERRADRPTRSTPIGRSTSAC